MSTSRTEAFITGVHNLIQPIYEDNHFLIVNKPAGIAVQADKTGDLCLRDVAMQWLKDKYNKPGNVFCGITHRIDRPVSGIVVLAKTSKALARTNELFKERTIEKTYLCIVSNAPEPPAGNLVHWLEKNPHNNKTTAYTKEKKGALLSELSYDTLAEEEGHYLLKIKPITGRSHQIRSQLAAIKSPIRGDVKYGYPAGFRDRAIALHAYKIAFEHPITQQIIQLTAGIPTAGYWKIFEQHVRNTNT